MAFKCPKCGRFVKGTEQEHHDHRHVLTGNCKKCKIDIKAIIDGYFDDTGEYCGAVSKMVL